MKTHLDQFKDMLISIGYNPEIKHDNDRLCITLSSNQENVHGYMGFVAHFEFNEDGSLNNIGIYE